MKKNDPRKQVIAWILKTKTRMKNEWITDQLHMGHWTSVTKAGRKVREGKTRELKLLRTKLTKTLKISDLVHFRGTVSDPTRCPTPFGCTLIVSLINSYQLQY
jgi:hypothetical protein